MLFEQLVASGVPAVNIVFPPRRARVRPRFTALVTPSTDGVVLSRALPGAHAMKCLYLPLEFIPDSVEVPDCWSVLPDGTCDRQRRAPDVGVGPT